MSVTTADIKEKILRDKADRIVRKLREYHRRGCEARDSSITSSAHWMTLWKVSDSTARKIRAFAKGYGRRPLEELCNLRRDNGLPFHWGYVSCFLTVTDPTRRRELQRRAAAENWSVAELQAKVLKSSDPKRVTGRRLKPLTNRLRAVQRIALDVHGLNRRIEQARDEWESLKSPGNARNQIRVELARIKRQLKQAVETLAQVRPDSIVRGRPSTRR